MRALRIAVFVATTSLATISCSSMPSPIPVSGTSARISDLAGTWRGDYSGPATGRHGSIRLTLAAGQSANGITGRYQARNTLTGETTWGEWNVQRETP